MLYADDDDGEEEPAQLVLVTNPLAVAKEIQEMFTAQLIDYETALPAAMHSLGATTEEIEAAMKRAKEKDEKKCQCEDEDRALQKQDAELSVKEREAGLATNGEKAKVEVEQAKANVEKTKKETVEIGKAKPASSSSGSSGSSGSSA